MRRLRQAASSIIFSVRMVTTEEESPIKGPGLRIKFDAKRAWKCPACGKTVRLVGEITSSQCSCTNPPNWMHLQPDPPKPQFSFEKVSIPEPEIEEEILEAQPAREAEPEIRPDPSQEAMSRHREHPQPERPEPEGRQQKRERTPDSDREGKDRAGKPHERRDHNPRDQGSPEPPPQPGTSQDSSVSTDTPDERKRERNRKRRKDRKERRTHDTAESPETVSPEAVQPEAIDAPPHKEAETPTSQLPSPTPEPPANREDDFGAGLD